MIARLICRLFGHSGAVYQHVHDLGGGQYKITHDCPRCHREYDPAAERGILLRTVSPGDKIPHGYAVAWRHWSAAKAYCMPIPLNLVVAAIDRAYWWARAPRLAVDNPRQAYELGRAAGYQSGWVDGRIDAQREAQQ